MYYIGVDLGGTNIAAGIVDGDNGKIVVKGSVPTLAEREGEEIVKDMAALCEKLVADANLTKADIASVGIAAPGSADCEGGIIIYANNLRFYDFHIADINCVLAGDLFDLGLFSYKDKGIVFAFFLCKSNALNYFKRCVISAKSVNDNSHM